MKFLSVKKLILFFCVFVFLVIALLPVLSMVLRSFVFEDEISMHAYYSLFGAKQGVLMGHSILLALAVSIGTAIVGIPLGILLGKTDLISRRLFTAFFALPLLIPPYILALAWHELLGGYESFMGFWGVAMVLFSVFLPIPIMFTSAFLRTIDPALEEAGLMMTNWRGVLTKISFPLIFPALLFSIMLVFLLTLGQFSVPSFLRYSVYPVESFVQFSAFYNFEAATASAMPLVFIALILLVLEGSFLREGVNRINVTFRTKGLIIPLGRYRITLSILVASLITLVVFTPLLILFRQSEPSAYIEAFERAGDSLFRSLLFALIGASLITVLGFFMGYFIQQKTRGGRMVDSVALFLFALPSTVIGIGLIRLWNTPWTNFIYATPAIIIIGYIAKYTVLASRISEVQLSRISPSMEEAARLSGANWFQRFFRITLPLSKRGIFASWIVSYLFALRDTEITMLVYPPGEDTLPVRIFTLMANGSSELVASLCIMMVVLSLLPIGVLWWVSLRKETR